MAMQLKYNGAGQPYLVGSSGSTVGPALQPRPSPLNSQPRAKTVAAKAAKAALNEVSKALDTAAPPASEKAGDPVGKFLDYDFGAGVKMKFALPAFMLLLVLISGKRK